MDSPSRAARILVAAAAGLALADASIVALALPPILDEMNTTVTGVAAIVGVYALVLAAAILPAERLVRRYGPSATGAAGLLVFAAASLGCAVAPSLTPLLVFRGVQAAGGAAGLLAAFDILDAGASAHGRRLWLGAALAGTAAGPAIGGALTQALRLARDLRRPGPDLRRRRVGLLVGADGCGAGGARRRLRPRLGGARGGDRARRGRAGGLGGAADAGRAAVPARVLRRRPPASRSRSRPRRSPPSSSCSCSSWWPASRCRR